MYYTLLAEIVFIRENDFEFLYPSNVLVGDEYAYQSRGMPAISRDEWLKGPLNSAPYSLIKSAQDVCIK